MSQTVAEVVTRIRMGLRDMQTGNNAAVGLPTILQYLESRTVEVANKYGVADTTEVSSNSLVANRHTIVLPISNSLKLSIKQIYYVPSGEAMADSNYTRTPLEKRTLAWIEERYAGNPTPEQGDPTDYALEEDTAAFWTVHFWPEAGAAQAGNLLGVRFSKVPTAFTNALSSSSVAQDEPMVRGIEWLTIADCIRVMSEENRKARGLTLDTADKWERRGYDMCDDYVPKIVQGSLPDRVTITLR